MGPCRISLSSALPRRRSPSCRARSLLSTAFAAHEAPDSSGKGSFTKVPRVSVAVRARDASPAAELLLARRSPRRPLSPPCSLECNESASARAAHRAARLSHARGRRAKNNRSHADRPRASRERPRTRRRGEEEIASGRATAACQQYDDSHHRRHDRRRHREAGFPISNKIGNRPLAKRFSDPPFVNAHARFSRSDPIKSTLTSAGYRRLRISADHSATFHTPKCARYDLLFLRLGYRKCRRKRCRIPLSRDGFLTSWACSLR